MKKRFFQNRFQNKDQWKRHDDTVSISNVEIGSFVHACEGEMLYASTHTKIPYFNAPVYLENKCLIGKIDEILGPMNQVYFTVKPQEGIIASSFHTGDKVYIGNDKLLPLERFLSQPKSSIPKKTQVSSRGGYQNRSRGLYRGLGKKRKPSFNSRPNSASFRKFRNTQMSRQYTH